MADSEQLIFEGCGCTDAPTARRAPRRAAARRTKPERFVISSQAVDADGIYRDIEDAAARIAVDKFGSGGARFGVQMVLPGEEMLVDGFEAYIGHSGDPDLSEVIIIAVHFDRARGKSRRSGQERLVA